MKLNFGLNIKDQNGVLMYSDEEHISSLRDSQKDYGGGFVYVLKSGDFYKIGMTAHLEARYCQLTNGVPFDAEYVNIIYSKEYADLEKILHRIFEPKRVEGTREWFRLYKHKNASEFCWDDDFQFINRLAGHWNATRDEI
jgi:hypothetical protein